MAKVLLIEPDAVLARTYMYALEQIGHEVHTAATAQAGVDVADRTSPDVVLLELQLVAHSGIEFLYEFRSYSDWQSVPVIILSHVPPAEFKESAGVMKESLGVQEYYYKPKTNLKRIIQIVDAATVRT
jgi:DNA-binding response OmpR family regulator